MVKGGLSSVFAEAEHQTNAEAGLPLVELS